MTTYARLISETAIDRNPPRSAIIVGALRTQLEIQEQAIAEILAESVAE